MKSKKQLKKELHQLIDSIEDEHVLNVLNDDVVPFVIQSRIKETDAGEDDLTAEQEKELKKAMGEADRGETISFEEFKEQTEQWLTDLKSTKGL